MGINGKVTLRFLLNGAPQMQSGENIGILGCSEEFDSWKKILHMSWNEKGWAGQLEFETKGRAGELIEFKFVIVHVKDKNNVVVLEERDDRKFTLPQDGFYQMVCQWNNTGEPVNLSTLDGTSNYDKLVKEKTLFAAMETVINMMKEAKLREEKAELFKKEAPSGGLEDTFKRVEGLRQMMQRAREANDMILEMVTFARELLREQELIMEKVVQESDRLQQEPEQNSELGDMDRECVVDVLQREIAVICKDVKFLKQKFDECVPFSKKVSSSGSFSKGLIEDWFPEHDQSSGTPKKVTTPAPSVCEDHPLMNKDTKFDGKESLSDDDWDMFEDETSFFP